MIVDPPDGRFPPLTPAGQMAKNNRTRGDDSWDDRHIWERCVTRGGMPNAMFPRSYNNNIQVFQAPGYVAVLMEQIHETRIIPWMIARRSGRVSGSGTEIREATGKATRWWWSPGILTTE